MDGFSTKLDIHICGPLGLPFWPTSILREMVRLSTPVLMLRRRPGSEKAADALAQQKALRDVPAGGAWVAEQKKEELI